VICKDILESSVSLVRATNIGGNGRYVKVECLSSIPHP
ncbi:unnamed protein product, partial [Vitis vinifera]